MRTPPPVVVLLASVLVLILACDGGPGGAPAAGNAADSGAAAPDTAAPHALLPDAAADPLPPRFAGPCRRSVDEEERELGRTEDGWGWLETPPDGEVDSVSRFTYDAAGRLLRTEEDQLDTPGLDAWTELAYDAEGEVAVRTAAWGGSETPLFRMTWSWDAARTVREERIEHLDEGTTDVRWWTVDAAGHPLAFDMDRDGDGVVDRSHVWTWEGDRPVLDEFDHDGDGDLEQRYRYGWDEAGRLAWAEAYEEDPDVLSVRKTHTYDAEGRLVLVQQTPGANPDATGVQTFEYRPDGTLREVRAEFGGELFDRTTFDELGRPVRTEMRDFGTETPALIVWREWEYDDHDRLAVERDVRSGAETRFAWDEAGNLLSETSPARVVTYDYGCWAGVADPPPPLRHGGRGCLPAADPRFIDHFVGELSPTAPLLQIEEFVCQDVVQ